MGQVAGPKNGARWVVICDLFRILGTDFDDCPPKHSSEYGGSNGQYERF